VLIQQHGLPVYFKRFGVQDVATKQPMAPDTIFALHSLTKAITNLAAMMLIDDGKLTLDDPVSKYIPAFAAIKVGVESETKAGQAVLSLVPTDRSVSIGTAVVELNLASIPDWTCFTFLWSRPRRSANASYPSSRSWCMTRSNNSRR
jgi:Beta-lactamase